MIFLTEAWNRISTFVIQYIVEPLKAITFMDVLDILILAVILYRLLVFARARRAGRVLLGLVGVIGAGLIVKLLNFPTLGYVAGILASSAFFCIVVLFQPEIRDALEHLGNCRLFAPRANTISRKRYGMAETLTDETVDAVFKMSRSKCGALIVFEGLTKLGDYMSTGKKLDCEVTSPLLQNIFYDKAPLHDGALIIRDMRICAASCVLPPSRKNLDEDHLGTRHRAAVGVTEVSDALVIVISEQSGTVSVAQDGKLLRGVDAKTLKDILMTYIAGSAYLHKKRANMRSEYLQMLDRIGQIRTPKKDDTSNREEFDRSIQKFISRDATDEQSTSEGTRKQANVSEQKDTVKTASEDSADQNL